MDRDLNFYELCQLLSSEGYDNEMDIPSFSDAEEACGLQDDNTQNNVYCCLGGHGDDLNMIDDSDNGDEQIYGRSIMNQPGNDIVFDFAQDEKNLKVYWDRCIYHNGAPFDKILNNVMYYDGQKISMKNKIMIFNLALKKYNELEGNCEHQIKRLTRQETRSLERLNKRLSEVIDFIWRQIQSGDKDFLDLIGKLQPKKRQV